MKTQKRGRKNYPRRPSGTTAKDKRRKVRHYQRMLRSFNGSTHSMLCFLGVLEYNYN